MYSREEKSEISDVEPAQDPVDDGPNGRMVRIIGNCDGQGRAETNPVFGALDTTAVIFFSHYLTSVIRRSLLISPARCPVAVQSCRASMGRSSHLLQRSRNRIWGTNLGSRISTSYKIPQFVQLRHRFRRLSCRPLRRKGSFHMSLDNRNVTCVNGRLPLVVAYQEPWPKYRRRYRMVGEY
jgi:hypothetical protein